MESFSDFLSADQCTENCMLCASDMHVPQNCTLTKVRFDQQKMVTTTSPLHHWASKTPWLPNIRLIVVLWCGAIAAGCHFELLLVDDGFHHFLLETLCKHWVGSRWSWNSGTKLKHNGKGSSTEDRQAFYYYNIMQFQKLYELSLYNSFKISKLEVWCKWYFVSLSPTMDSMKKVYMPGIGMQDGLNNGGILPLGLLVALGRVQWTAGSAGELGRTDGFCRISITTCITQWSPFVFPGTLAI